MIGEAIKQPSKEVIAKQPHIDWRSYAGYRDILVHLNHSAQLDVPWTVVQNDVPPLKAAIEAILASMDVSIASA